MPPPLARTFPRALVTETLQGRAIVLDTETTGFTPKKGDRLVEIAAIEMDGGRPTGRTFRSLINPGRHVPAQAARVHGLTDTKLADQPGIEDVAGAFLDFIGSAPVPIWAHNAAFDRRFLNAEIPAATGRYPPEIHCSMLLARRLSLGTPDLRLETLATLAGHCWTGQAHSALEDTRALGTVLARVLCPRALALLDQEARSDSRTSKSRSTSAKRDTSRPSADSGAGAHVLDLPDGYTPATAATDPRLRRYDREFSAASFFARGARWSADEDRGLARRFLDGASMADLIAAHGRSPAALILRLESLGIVAPDHPYTR